VEVVLPGLSSICLEYDFLRFGTVQVVFLCPVIDVREFCDTRSAVLCRHNHIHVVGKYDKKIAVVLGSQM